MVSGAGRCPGAVVRYLVSACLLSVLLYLPEAQASINPQSGECKGKGKDCTGKGFYIFIPSDTNTRTPPEQKQSCQTEDLQHAISQFPVDTPDVTEPGAVRGASRCICNIICSRHNENVVCATDGNSYDNPCLVREASCMKQEQIDVKHLGKCPADKEKMGKKDDGSPFKVNVLETKGLDHSDGFYAGMPIPCTDSYAGFCVHGKCEIKYNMATCRCDSGYKGPQCDEPQDFNILYVVPSGQKLHYVLIAAIIGAVQIAIIVAVVMCITRKCPKNNRGRRQKQNLGHFSSDTNSRMV
ncbi:tomoregulin-1-like [Scomber scombrus]|uniref:tomoregulin-1-like n=1 Tax=Scomber scombrus TaxID=13677 RepID=UPI002DDC6A6F|nr:tomoregulin-1-like [Scomber scombrus]